MTPRTTYSSISTLRINGLEEINMLTVFGCIKMYEMPVYDMHRERTVYTRFIMTYNGILFHYFGVNIMYIAL